MFLVDVPEHGVDFQHDLETWHAMDGRQILTQYLVVTHLDSRYTDLDQEAI